MHCFYAANLDSWMHYGSGNTTCPSCRGHIERVVQCGTSLAQLEGEREARCEADIQRLKERIAECATLLSEADVNLAFAEANFDRADERERRLRPPPGTPIDSATSEQYVAAKDDYRRLFSEVIEARVARAAVLSERTSAMGSLGLALALLREIRMAHAVPRRRARVV